MARQLVPIHIKSHLVPFLFREFDKIDAVYVGRKVVAAYVTNHSVIGRMVSLLLKPSQKKPTCDKKQQIFLSVAEAPNYRLEFENIYSRVDGRSQFVFMPDEGSELINANLELLFEACLMNYINGWHEKKGSEGIDIGIVKFCERYDLEEYNYNVLRIRRDYYRKLNSGYFNARVTQNPVGSGLISR